MQVIKSQIARVQVEQREYEFRMPEITSYEEVKNVLNHLLQEIETDQKDKLEQEQESEKLEEVVNV